LLVGIILFVRKFSIFIGWGSKGLILWLLCLFSSLVYGGILLGWVRGRKFGVLGGLRATIQAFSFDFLIFVLLLFFFCIKEVSFLQYVLWAAQRGLISPLGGGSDNSCTKD